MLSDEIVANIRKIMADTNLTQSVLAEYAGTSESQFSKILNGKVKLSLEQLENLARGLSLRAIDIITYPVVYEERGKNSNETVEAVLQIKLKKDKKDQVLRLIFGDNDIEILNN